MSTANQLERAALLLSERSRLTRIVSYWGRGGSMVIHFSPNIEGPDINVIAEDTKEQEGIINLLLTRNSTDLKALGISV